MRWENSHILQDSQLWVAEAKRPFHLTAPTGAAVEGEPARSTMSEHLLPEEPARPAQPSPLQMLPVLFFLGTSRTASLPSPTWKLDKGLTLVWPTECEKPRGSRREAFAASFLPQWQSWKRSSHRSSSSQSWAGPLPAFEGHVA